MRRNARSLVITATAAVFVLACLCRCAHGGKHVVDKTPTGLKHAKIVHEQDATNRPLPRSYKESRFDIGFRALFSGDGIRAVAAALEPVVLMYINSTKIDNIEGEVSSGIPGVHINYKLSDIKITEAQIESFDVNLLPDNDDIEVEIDELKLHLHHKWSYEGHPVHIKGHGTADEDLHLLIKVQLDFNNNGLGEPTMDLKGLSTDLTHLGIDVHGGPSWFFDAMEKIFHEKMKHRFEAAVQSALKSSIEHFDEKYVETFPITIAITGLVGVDYGLSAQADNPFVRDYGSFSDHLGRFYLLNDTSKTCTRMSPPAYMLPSVDSLSYLQLMVSDYMVWTLGCAYFAADQLRYSLTNANLPAGFPGLNTSLFAYIIPQLYEDYPNDAMQLVAYAASPPSVSMSLLGVNISVIGNSTVYVITKANQTIPVFTLGTYVDLTLKAGVRKGNVTAHISDSTIGLKLLWSGIGEFEVGALQFLAEVLLDAGLVPFLNDVGQVGIPVPYISSQNIELSDTDFVYKDRYFLLNTRFVWHVNDTVAV